MLAFLFVECVKDQAESVRRHLRQIRGVAEAHSTASGQYDVIVKIQAHDEARLRRIVDTVKAVAGIIAVDTAIAYSHVN